MTVKEANKILEIKAQIQEDILTYMDSNCCFTVQGKEEMLDDLCQIVVENFENTNL
jgi:hypothetical protein